MREIDLNGRWTLTRKNDATFAPVKCDVPGTVPSALLRAGRVTDPAGADAVSEAERSALAHSTWVLTRTFDVDSAALSETFADLRFGGIDTLASVKLNGHEVLRASNAFRGYTASVAKHLKRGRNSLSVEIRPATPATAPHKPRMYFTPSPSAPALHGAGLFRPVRLLAWSVARFSELGFGQRHGLPDGSVELHVGGWIEMAEETDASALRVEIRVADADGNTAWRGDAEFADGGDDGAFHAVARIASPELWWPAGMGEQPLYTVTAVLSGSAGEPLDIAVSRVGLRTLAPETGADGVSRLVCNGRPLFLRGAVWTPPHPLDPFTTREDYEPLLAGARDACFNALRLPADAPPEGEPFFEICDEFGIIVLGMARLGEEASADSSDDDAADTGFLNHACVPDVLIGEPDEDGGLVVERGHVSCPAPETFNVAFRAGERNIASPLFENRIALRGGSAALISTLAARWPVPETADGWLVFSQLEQATAMRDRIGEARAGGRASGVLFPAFASVWACADASSVDSAGRWKALQYEAARSFAPQALFGGTFLNDSPEPLENARFTWRLTTMDGTTVREGMSRFSVAAFSKAELSPPDVEPFMRHYDRGDLVLWTRVTDADGFVVARRHAVFAPPKALRLRDPGIALEIAEEPTDDGQQVFRVIVSAEAPAFEVNFSLPGRAALFGDGFFSLEPDETLDVFITPISPVKPAALRRELRVRSLYDLIHR